MNIDIAALRAIEADKGISAGTIIAAIETALLTAYRHTEGHQPHARIDVDTKSGVVRVMARDVDSDGNQVGEEWDDTPEGFGRIAATTARQVILQRLRDAEHERSFGEFATHEGEIVGGVIQRDTRANARGMVVVRIGSEANGAEGLIPPAEQVPGRPTSTVTGSSAMWSVSPVDSADRRSRCRARTRTWCGNCSRSRSPRSPTGPSRSSRSLASPATDRRSRSTRACPV